MTKLNKWKFDYTLRQLNNDFKLSFKNEPVSILEVIKGLLGELFYIALLSLGVTIPLVYLKFWLFK